MINDRLKSTDIVWMVLYFLQHISDHCMMFLDLYRIHSGVVQ